MSDERMDAQLRDYAARWTAAHPAPDGVVLPERRRRSWVPWAVAASVVALVAGVVVAVTPRSPHAPVASPSPSVSPSPAVPPPPCGDGDVTGTVSLTRDQPYSVGGELVLSAATPCAVAAMPRLEILGDDLSDIGVRFSADSDDGATISATPRRLLLAWSGSLCAPTRILVLRVTLAEDVAFRVPLDPLVHPTCRHGDGRSRLSATWAAPECGDDDFEVVSATSSVVEAREPFGTAVRMTAVVRNVSGDFCFVSFKPRLRVVGADGRAAHLSNVANSDARQEPPLAPGRELRADVTWLQYCGPSLGAYTARMELWTATVALPLAGRPVPACHGEPEPDQDGFTESDWVTVLPAG
jgi:hypothetical protein